VPDIILPIIYPLQARSIHSDRPTTTERVTLRPSVRALYRTAQKGFEETRAEQTALCDHLREETGSLHATSVVRV
jgi:hypothetical protein